MVTWLVYLWKRVRDSLWALPGVMSLAAGGLAYLTTRLDPVVADAEIATGLLYHGSPEGVRTLLSTVAGSMITVAGVSFSVTMVALSLASTQLGPRLLVSFMQDRGNQLVLGGFIGTFLYCLMALSSVPAGSERFVSVTATLALLLAIVSLGLLIYFIHHIAISMQADTVVDNVASGLESALKRIFPERVDSPQPDAKLELAADPWIVSARRTGYIQAIDEPGLLRLASEQDLRIHVLHRAGHFLVAGAPLAALAGHAPPGSDTEVRIRKAFILGGRRTAEQDPEHGLRQLVEIAVRALSPGINDPFTACSCVDRLSGVLGAIADRPELPPVRWDAAGVPRLRLDRIAFPGLLDAAFDQIRQCAANVPAVSIRLLEALGAIVRVTSDAARRDALARHARMVLESCAGDAWNPRDREALEQRHRDFSELLEAPAAQAEVRERRNAR